MALSLRDGRLDSRQWDSSGLCRSASLCPADAELQRALWPEVRYKVRRCPPRSNKQRNNAVKQAEAVLWWRRRADKRTSSGLIGLYLGHILPGSCVDLDMVFILCTTLVKRAVTSSYGGPCHTWWRASSRFLLLYDSYGPSFLAKACPLWLGRLQRPLQCSGANVAITVHPVQGKSKYSVVFVSKKEDMDLDQASTATLVVTRHVERVSAQ